MEQEQMESLDRTIRCSLCTENSGRWIEFESVVFVKGKGVKMRDMIEIFHFPQDTNLLQTEGICLKCFEQLECCYSFYHTILTTATTKQERCHSGKEIPHTDCDSTPGTVVKMVKDEETKQQQHHEEQQPSQFHYCQVCRKTFKTNRGMLQHNAIYHESSEPHSCHICERHFLTRTNLQNHLRWHKDYVCCYCNGGWIGGNQLLTHVRTVHADRLFVCRSCNKQERLKKSLNRHIRSAHGMIANPYYCGHCDSAGRAVASFDCYEALEIHLHEQHALEKGDETEKDSYGQLLNDSLFGKELELPDVPPEAAVDVERQEEFLRNLSLIRNVPEKQAPAASRPLEPRIDQRMVLEDFLDEAFENDEIWNKYIENGEEYLIDDYGIYLQGIEGTVAEQEASCMYLCPQCQRGFQRQRALTIHLAEEHDVPSLVCNDCGVSFTRQASYRMHRREHLKENVRFRESNIPEMEEALSLVQSKSSEYSVHEEETGYIFTCNLCDRTFRQKHNLEKHRCMSSGPQDNAETSPELHCSDCPFRTLSAKELEAHRRLTHQPDDTAPSEPIYCMLCDRRFSSTSGLKYHLKRHTGIKAFACLYCEKTFTANSNLSSHIRAVHSERKDYRCDECAESFTTKDHLNKHQRSRHRRERPFVCGECGKSYLQRSHLSDHVAACHREDRYLCQLCNDSSFVSKSSLRRHQRKKHECAVNKEK